MKKIVKGIKVFEEEIEPNRFGLPTAIVDRKYYEVDGVPSEIRSDTIYLKKDISEIDRYLLKKDTENYKKYLASSFSQKIGEMVYEALDIESRFDNIEDDHILITFTVENLDKLNGGK